MALDKISVDRINQLHPKYRDFFLEVYSYANEKLLPKGVRLRITQGLRTIKEQNDLYSLGRTKQNPDGISSRKPMGNIVTNAKGGSSNHNYGIAIDIVILYDKDKNDSFETVSWDINDKYFIKVKDYFISKGLYWGGNFRSFPDYPHFEIKTGFTVSELKTKVDAKYTIDNIYPKL